MREVRHEDLSLGFRALVFVPPGYNPAHPCPLVIFFHGRDERGEALSRLAGHGLLAAIQAGRALPALVAAPQCPKGTTWQAQITAVDRFVLALMAQYLVDERRIYLTGVSMGGQAVYSAALHSPQRYAALVPVCAPCAEDQIEPISHIPTWLFHGKHDRVVPADTARRVFAALQAAGGKARLTCYNDLGHQVWQRAYGDDHLYHWLFAQARPPVNETPG
jgi:predicted peptidase